MDNSISWFGDNVCLFFGICIVLNLIFFAFIFNYFQIVNKIRQIKEEWDIKHEIKLRFVIILVILIPAVLYVVNQYFTINEILKSLKIWSIYFSILTISAGAIFFLCKLLLMFFCFIKRTLSWFFQPFREILYDKAIEKKGAMQKKKREKEKRQKEEIEKKTPKYLICLYRFRIGPEYHGFYGEIGINYQNDPYRRRFVVKNNLHFSFDGHKSDCTKVADLEYYKNLSEKGIVGMLERAVHSGYLDKWFDNWDEKWHPGNSPFIFLYFNSQKKLITDDFWLGNIKP